MPIPTQQPASSLGSMDPLRAEDAIARIAPKWTTWTAMTLAQSDRPLRVRDVAARLPFVSEQNVSKRLATMHADGLVTREGDPRAPYRLSQHGEALAPVHKALSAWSRAHLQLGPVADAERVEDALRRLHLRHTTAIVQALHAGPMRYVHISEATGIDTSYTGQRLLRLQADGLVGRTGRRHGDPYELTEAGRALGAVYASVEQWYEPAARRSASAPARLTAPARAHADAPLLADSARNSAALRRSTVAPSSLFSHAAQQPQRRAPTAVTTQSAPGRGR